jgi:tetratricopeptide (TPR) repeat protein/Zn-dependent protease
MKLIFALVALYLFYKLIKAISQIVLFCLMIEIDFPVFQCLKIESPVSEEVPEHIKTIFREAIAQLEPYGFRLASYFQWLEHGVPKTSESWKTSKSWGVLLQHASQQVYAQLTLRQPLNSQNLFNLTFSTFFEDGCLLTTVPPCSYSSYIYELYGSSPDRVSVHLQETSLEKQWQVYQDKLQQLSQEKTPLTLSPESFITFLETHHKTEIERLLKRHALYWVEPGATYRLTWWKAIEVAFKFARRDKTLEALAKTPPFPFSIDETAMIELEMDEFYCWKQQKPVRLSRRTRSWLSLGTLAFFIALFSAVSDPQKLFILLAMLLLHEGGHVLAMRLSGYRNAMMLFIPFFGGLAIAQKENASLTEKVRVYLAGPLPGLFLGIGLAIAFRVLSSGDINTYTWFEAPAWVRDAVWILVVLNLFNLLPVYPLDGGQIADLLLFSGHPRLGALFQVISVCFLGLVGLRYSFLLVVFAILIGLTIPGSFCFAKLNVTLRQELRQFPLEDQRDLVRRIFSKLQKTDFYRSWSFDNKYNLAVTLLENLREDTAKWTTRCGLAGIYLASLLTGIAGGFYALGPNWTIWTTMVSYLTSSKVQQLQQKLQHANQRLELNSRDVDAYVQRAQARIDLQDFSGAIADYNQILQLAPSSHQVYSLRSQARFRVGDIAGSRADLDQFKILQQRQRLQKLDRALSKNPNDDFYYFQRAGVRAEMGDFRGAIADYSQVLRLSPGKREALVMRGNAYFQLKDYQRAIADADQVLSLKPEFYSLTFHEPFTYRRKDLYELLYEAHKLRGQVLRQLGDEKGAIAEEQKAEACITLEQLCFQK